jgi:hypothetical protein
VETELSREEHLGRNREERARERKRFDALLAQAQPWEREYFEESLDEWESAEIVPSEELPLEQRFVAERDYARNPVPIREFIYDDFYLGKVMRGDVFRSIL